MTNVVRTDGKISKACCAPGSSAETSGARTTRRKASQKWRASSIGTSVSCVPCRTRKGGASGRRRESGDAFSYTSGAREGDLQHPPLEEPAEPVVGPEAVAVREVVDPVEGHAAVDRGVDALEAGLVLGGVWRESDERGQVRARRAAGHDQKVGIGAVQRAVLADPGDGAL